jgi:23S rRNA (uracil1939-C5)-methyltransferase
MELWGSPLVSDRIGGAQMSRHVRSFFQGNRFLTQALVDYVLSLIESGPTLDLYAGVGLFSIPAVVAGRGPLTAVEGDPFSATDLKRNATGKNMTIYQDSVESFVARSQPAFASVIVDPPRTGLSKDAITGLIKMRPPTVAYVSCDIATLARDARVLLDAGYQIKSVRAFDLFPNTAHVETVTAFAR